MQQQDPSRVENKRPRAFLDDDVQNQQEELVPSVETLHDLPRREKKRQRPSLGDCEVTPSVEELPNEYKSTVQELRKMVTDQASKIQVLIDEKEALRQQLDESNMICQLHEMVYDLELDNDLHGSIMDLKNRRVLDLECSGVDWLPPAIAHLTNLEVLNLKSMKDLPDLPDEIGDLESLKSLHLSDSNIEEIPTSIGLLQNLEDLHLDGMKKLSSLPEEIGELKNLKSLDVSYTNIKAIPTSIGLLKNLEVLKLNSMDNLLSLPEEIGGMTKLKELSLMSSKIKVLPSSIDKLKNLEVLNLNSMHNLLSLPEMTNLKKLSLLRSKIKVLPSSIGKLKNLEVLNLNSMDNLLSLPEEIGGMTNLKELSLDRSKIKVLPSSIGKLKNLNVLRLYGTKNLLELPSEIGDLKKLKFLDLRSSGILELPNSFYRLTSLCCLGLCGIPCVQKEKRDGFLRELLQRLPLLGYYASYRDLNFPNDINFKLACNRARSVIGYGDLPDNGSMQPMAALWHLILYKSVHAFKASQFYRTRVHSRSYRIEQPDAIYQILSIRRGSFLRLISDRRSNDTVAPADRNSTN